MSSQHLGYVSDFYSAESLVPPLCQYNGQQILKIPDRFLHLLWFQAWLDKTYPLFWQRSQFVVKPLNRMEQQAKPGTKPEWKQQEKQLITKCIFQIICFWQASFS